jgi:hypothetical protein
MDHLQTIYIQLLQKFPKLLTLCSLLGALLILSKILKTLRFVYKNFLRKRRNLLQRYGENSWVFITGSSDGNLTSNIGIGRAFAHAFAKRGFNIILCARTESKLQKVQEELQTLNPKIQVRYVRADFAESHRPDFFDSLTE